jgi:hypothetical protein
VAPWIVIGRVRAVTPYSGSGSHSALEAPTLGAKLGNIRPTLGNIGPTLGNIPAAPPSLAEEDDLGLRLVDHSGEIPITIIDPNSHNLDGRLMVAASWNFLTGPTFGPNVRSMGTDVRPMCTSTTGPIAGATSGATAGCTPSPGAMLEVRSLEPLEKVVSSAAHRSAASSSGWWVPQIEGALNLKANPKAGPKANPKVNPKPPTKRNSAVMLRGPILALSPRLLGLEVFMLELGVCPLPRPPREETSGPSDADSIQVFPSTLKAPKP